MLALKYSISDFFFPSPRTLYLFIYPVEIGAIFDQSDEKASAQWTKEGERKLLAEDTHPPAIGLLQMDIGFHQSASNSAGKA